jgi:sigma-B regulation protein RsbU (phosphoserine phosphatase)
MNDIPLILVVDDEAMNRKILDWALSEAGFQVAAAASGAEAVEAAQARKPDLIILDIMLPGEDGFAVCRRLQASPATRDIPIIFLSGLSDTGDKVRGLGMGAVDYVTKPFSGAEVVARTRTHLNLRRARQALIEEQARRISTIRQAQQSMLVSPQELPQARFAVRFITADEAGGDIYDVFAHSEHTHAYFVADVTGHDLGASFWTPAAKTLIRQNAGPLYRPGETFATMNGVLRQVLGGEQMLTAAYLSVNRSSGRARLVRAGHPAPVLTRSGQTPEFLAPEGDVLGGFDAAMFEEMTLRVAPGDRFLLYTDGLVERSGRTLASGQEELLRACAATAGLPLEEALDALSQTLLPRTGLPEDDVVLLMTEV